MKKPLGPSLLVVLLGLVVLGIFLWDDSPPYQWSNPPPVAAPADVPDEPAAPNEAAIQYPVPETAEKPLPPLEKSDAAALAALADVFGKQAVKQLFQPQEVIRRIVVTVDSLPREVVSVQLQPTVPVAGKLRTAGKGMTLTLSQTNFERYTPFVRLAEKVDAKTFVTAYTALYPLFQQAYRDLGYPKGYFNDRLVNVIDHMLEAPKVEGPIALIQPHIFYRFADPDLQALSAGHKLMLRIGDANATKVKKKLREIRKELVSIPPQDR